MGAGEVSMWGLEQGEDYLRSSESFRSPDPYEASDWSVLGTRAARDLRTVRSTKGERLEVASLVAQEAR
jgi:hypothetical protein